MVGEIIVQLNKGENIENFIKSHNSFKGFNTNLAISQTLVPSLNIYLLKFNEQDIEAESFLQKLNADKKVLYVQSNHVGNFRSEIPSDTLFPSQWQYINDGSNNGVENADIDADLAWEITTGGYTFFGDTIVVCVVDNGTRQNHPDFQENYWYNTKEIPNNNTDDDGNGYVDDYRGWNVITNNDVINESFDGHGTSVAGVIGADGNNVTGVAGVNWTVKVMNIRQAGTSEADVIAAYNYPYIMRKMYNETNGEKGAFVVAVNSSWGVNFGNPDDAPIWCNFYNTMGEEGVLNFGATANANVNVDVQGDLPTGCISDYLVSVTNLQRNDVKRPQAGYGLNSIHLGAYGHQTYTLDVNSGYGAFGGTSAATPHVAGVAALMYSVACPSFSYLAKSAPQEAALQVRNALLESVVPNASLANITVTGGRLNAYNAVLEMQDNCEELDPCLAPFSLNNTLEIDENVQSLLVTWQDINENTFDYVFEYRFNNSETFTQVNLDATVSEYLIENIAFCTEIEVKIKCNCAEDDVIFESAYSASSIVISDGCCENPLVLDASEITQNEATITWNTFLAAENFDLRYREVGNTNNDWVTIENIEETSYTIQQLTLCTVYEFELRANCVNNSDVALSEWVSGSTFTTKGCGACTDFVYCDAFGTNTSDEWIESVSFNEFENISGNNGGYANFTEEYTIQAERGEEITAILVPEHSGILYPERFRVAIDYNHDGVFETSEIVFTSPVNTTQADTGVFVIPTDATLGITRLRVYMRYNIIPSLCGIFEYGETEDYCINISESTTGILNLNNYNQFKIFPNPSIGNFTVEPNKSFVGIANVIDVTGRTILSKAINNESVITFNIQNVKQGMYLLQFTDSNGTINTQRIIIE